MTFDTSKYKLGSLCKRGHDYDGSGRSLRYIPNGTCQKCKNLADKKTLVVHGDRYKAKAAQDYKNNVNGRRDRAIARVKAWNEANPGKSQQRCKTWYEANKDTLEYKEGRKKYIEENRAMLRQIQNEWRRNNPERYHEHVRRYDIKRKRNILNSGKVNPDDIGKLRELCNNECVYCGDRPAKLTLDHFKPLARGGTHTIDNLLLACSTCNSSKNDEDAFHWWASKPFWCIERYGQAFEIMRSWKAIAL